MLLVIAAIKRNRTIICSGFCIGVSMAAHTVYILINHRIMVNRGQMVLVKTIMAGLAIAAAVGAAVGSIIKADSRSGKATVCLVTD